VGVPATADWDGISNLVAAGDTVGRALFGGDAALGLGDAALGLGDAALGLGAAGSAAFLLVELAEPLMVRQPATGRVDDLHVELILLRGFRRFLPGTPVPTPTPGWTLDAAVTGLDLRDGAGNLWARVRARPEPRWLAAADRDRHIVVLYGPWLGVRTPYGVREDQYGAAQRSAELRAARLRGQVAVAAVPWRP
jgi:hypothetical protein